MLIRRGDVCLLQTVILFVTFCLAHSLLNRKTNPIVTQSYAWRCVKGGRCVRTDESEKIDVLSEIEEPSYSYLEGCKAVCGRYGALWPKPTGDVDLSPSLAPFLFDDLSFKLESSTVQGDDVLEDTMTQSWTIFTRNIQSLLPSEEETSKFSQGLPKNVQKRSQVLVVAKVGSSDLDLSLRTSEKYSLTIKSFSSEKVRNEIKVLIESDNFYGFRHGLETLSQLITFDPTEKCLRIPDRAIIRDAPIFPFRGILIDTGRNYFSLDSLKRIVDAMSYNKLNILHWHMNEQQSFPFVSERVPQLSSYGSYSKSALYYMDEVKSLTAYARLRGVLLLPEFDAPAHAAYGWQKWPAEKGLGNLTTCMGQVWKDEVSMLAAEPPAGQLNPTNDNLYEILGEVYKDMIESFAGSSSNKNKPSLNMFHMGGDEVNFQCWFDEKSVRDWMIQNHFEVNPSVSPEGYLKLWAIFQERALKKLVKANNGKDFQDGVLLWTSELTRPDKIYKYLDKDTYIVQAWTTGFDTWISDLLRMKYRMVLSNYDAWYFDCGYGSWLYSGSTKNNWCSPFKDWKVMYENSPREMVKLFGLDWSIYGDLILGGEATMWSEQVDEFAVEAKLWPRGCAVAERLWSDPLIVPGTYDPKLSPDKASYNANWWSEPERRILEQRRRMAVVRGIRADAIQPEFCRQHDGYCYNVPKPEPFPSINEASITFDESRRIAQILYQRSATKRHSYLLWVEYGVIIFIVAILIIRRRFVFGILTSCAEVAYPACKRLFCRKKTQNK